MKCNHCQSQSINIVTKNSGEKIYHCQNCGYNFTKEEISKKITVAKEFAPGQEPKEYQNRVNLDGTIVQAVLEVTYAVVKGLF
jgi:uncharacterized Zn finger protein